MSAAEIKAVWTPAAQRVAARHELSGAEYRAVELFALRRDPLPDRFVVTSAEVLAVVSCRASQPTFNLQLN